MHVHVNANANANVNVNQNMRVNVNGNVNVNVFSKVQLFFKLHVVGHALTNNIKSIIHRPAEGPTTAAAAVAAAAREIRGLAPQLHHY